MSEEKKILIAVPCMNQVPAEFAYSLANLTKIGQCATLFKIGTLVYVARDELAKAALACGADYIFWLDSDMEFQPDILKRMMQTYEENDVDILTGLYFRRVEPYTPTLFEHLNLDDENVEWSDFTRIDNKPFEVEGCGFGCILMKTEIFPEVQREFGCMFTPLKGMGEDLAFCWRARKLGYKIMCDPRILLGHIGYNIVTKDFFLKYQERSNNDKND